MHLLEDLQPGPEVSVQHHGGLLTVVAGRTPGSSDPIHGHRPCFRSSRQAAAWQRKQLLLPWRQRLEVVDRKIRLLFVWGRVNVLEEHPCPESTPVAMPPCCTLRVT
ncbi:hypothetical protein E2C01_010327 [Portunus trituberculatus]|uniref:Uncharacterized protein n=1 Tax=Portunus trituberculatus TaxID=210409 RepID=A0A5B7D848_PORTR|nr:hypothetical protein [Portunus trituberculatus]